MGVMDALSAWHQLPFLRHEPFPQQAVVCLFCNHPVTHSPTYPPPPQWRAAVDSRMDELVAQARQRHEQEAAAEVPPRPKAEAVGLKFV